MADVVIDTDVASLLQKQRHNCEVDRDRRNDTWIAACCLRYRVPLLTMNGRDFTDFVVHHGLVSLAE